MSDVWELCPSSAPYLKRCIEAASPQNDENKWFRRFKRKHEIIDEFRENSRKEADNIVTLVPDSDPERLKYEKEPISSPKIDEEICENLEVDIASKFNLLVEVCMNSPSIIKKLAQELSTSAVEKLCNHLFNKPDVNVMFLKLFYENFFTMFLKRDYSRFSLDLLVKAGNSHPEMFNKLLYSLFKDLEINNKVLLDFFQTLNDSSKVIFMNKITEIDLTDKEFEHSIFVIYTAYKNCKVTQKIQSYVENLIVRNYINLSSDKNFGKLLLAFLQEQKNFKSGDILQKLGIVIETHKTPFKKPCLIVLKDLISCIGT